ncbi:MAG: hypothetical protein FWF20_01495 [Betaproteobacteria bacterium]|nr:hypothetical protein [Betaproteobacteria bacterium]MCL2885456.1 hypothetical protein [Betaproteobacteria bacterium]
MERQSVEGMTANERLFHFGLFEKFDGAVRTRNVQSVVQVLLLAQFSEEQALQTATAMMADLSAMESKTTSA